tara:strand:+ start:3618 stop:3947 length:330 start_codon:yes stop_codon:yes gene_type:complete
MKFSFKYNGREINLDVKISKNISSQIRGLMFRRKSKPLVFIFKNKKKRAIHSLFCKPFIAIWFDGDKIVDVKKIKPWKFFIKPREKFDKLLEILLDDVTFKEFLDEENL